MSCIAPALAPEVFALARGDLLLTRTDLVLTPTFLVARQPVRRGFGHPVAEQRPPHQTRRKINVPLVPPNPNEFESAAFTGMLRAVCGT